MTEENNKNPVNAVKEYQSVNDATAKICVALIERNATAEQVVEFIPQIRRAFSQSATSSYNKLRGDQKPLSDLLCTVAERIQVLPGYEQAVDAALALKLQAVIAENPQAIQSWQRCLYPLLPCIDFPR